MHVLDHHLARFAGSIAAARKPAGVVHDVDEVVVPSGEPALINAFYLGWTIPLAGVMALSLYAPERLEALRRRALRVSVRA